MRGRRGEDGHRAGRGELLAALDLQRARSPRERATANIRAIRTLIELRDSGMTPDEAQIEALRGFSGWGGCADVFSSKPQWSDLNDELSDLLTEDEYAMARGSTLTAFYTPAPVVDAMWNELRSYLGDTDATINVLEPGCGTGNFLSVPPDGMDVSMTGVELDPISAAIATRLNPQATIVNADLAKCLIPSGSYDAAVGNVPYSGDITVDYKLLDGTTSRMPLHDYFIERTVDALRPGGVAVLLTSRYTLDKRTESMRADVARKAELAGLVRLPSATFDRQAGTEAVTDVLILRKRAKTLDKTPDEQWVTAAQMNVPGHDETTVTVNRLIADHPHTHVVGDITPVIGRFGGDFTVEWTGDERQIGHELQDKLETQADDLERMPLGERADEPAVVVQPDHVTAYEYTVDDRGVVWLGDDTTVEPVAWGDNDTAQRLRGMIRLRDLTRELQALELDPNQTDESAIDAKRAELNDAYDRFASRHGHLCEKANRKAYSTMEGGWHLLGALENVSPQGEWLGKARVFEQRTLTPVPPMPDHCDSLTDAFNVSMDREGKVDLDLIAHLTGMTAQEAETGLGDMIVRDPDTGLAVPADDYLSGDVVGKARHVRDMAGMLHDLDRRQATLAWHDHENLPTVTFQRDDDARQWLATVGQTTWDCLNDPYGTTSYLNPAPVMNRVRVWRLTWEHNPDLALALAARALDRLPEHGARLTRPANRDLEKEQGNGFYRYPSAAHDAKGANALWFALIWNSTGRYYYEPLLAKGNATIKDVTAFLYRLVGNDKVSRDDKTAIMRTMFDSMDIGSYSDHEWADTPVGDAIRQLLPDVAGMTELAEQAVDDPSIIEYLYSVTRDLPDDMRQAPGYNSRPAKLHVDREAWLDMKRRRDEFIDTWRDEHGAEIAEHETQAAGYDHLAAMLDNVRPLKLETEQVSAPLGAPWIPPRDIYDFMCHTFDVDSDGSMTPAKLVKFRVDYVEALGQWRVGYSGGGDIDYEAAKEFGTEDRNPFQLLEACLNNQQIRVMKDSPTETTKSGEPKKVVDEHATMAAVEKADHIRAAWNEWVFSDPQRAERLTALYNERFNNIRPRHVDGSYLTTPGIAAGMSLRPHQKDAVARALRSDEGTLIAHVVGAGKTFEGVALTHEAKRLGKASKPMLVVPNHLVDQWANDFMKLYPTSRILAMGKDDLRNPLAVRRFWGRVMTGDWDAVIVPESRFSQLHVSRDRRVANMQARIDEYVEAIKDAAKKNGDKDPTVKRLEAARKKVETSMERLRDGKESRDDAALNGIEFEQLGVDMLFVDEAHHFKNLGVPVAAADLGMQVSGAAKCEDMLDKCEWLREAGHAGNIVFATGTPVSNSMSELYNMQRYLAPGTLRAQGLGTFAAWAGTFGQVVPTVELKPEGTGFQVRQRFAKFQNLPELMNAVKQFSDVITNDDIDLKLPECEQIPVAVPITDSQRQEMDDLVERAERVRAGDVPPELDNMLRITGDGRKIALDPKLLDDDPGRKPLEDGGKIAKCAENVTRIWHETEADKGAQLVFCDTSTPASGKWNVYADLKRRLIDMGVPAEQIAFVHDAGDNPDKREALFEKVRNGEIRVLLGSTQKLGTGTNVQTRLAAVHDLDCPWRPADLEQRLGRIVRQGNMYGKVRDYRYVTEGTFDAFAYQTVERKQRFISQVMSSKSPAREASDLDDVVVDYASLKAIATGDPNIQKRMNLENEISQLTLLRSAHAREQAATRHDIDTWLEPAVNALRQTQQENMADKPIAGKALETHQRSMQAGLWEGIAINGQRYVDRKQAAHAITAAALTKTDRTIGEYDGLPVTLRFDQQGRAYLGIQAAYPHHASAPVPGADVTGNGSSISQLDRLIRQSANGGDDIPKRLAAAEAKLAAARNILGKPFDRETEYQAKKAELAKLIADEKRKDKTKEPPIDGQRTETAGSQPEAVTTEPAQAQVPEADVTALTAGDAETMSELRPFDLDLFPRGTVEAWWSDSRIDHNRIPEGYHRYSVRVGATDGANATIERSVWAGYAGDILTRQDLDPLLNGNGDLLEITARHESAREPLHVPYIRTAATDNEPERAPIMQNNDHQSENMNVTATTPPTEAVSADTQQEPSVNKFDYQLLSRLQADCEYYIRHPHDKHLWAGGVQEQIDKMRELYDKVPAKPEWLSSEDIDRYEQRMTAASLAAKTEDVSRSPVANEYADDPEVQAEQQRKTVLTQAMLGTNGEDKPTPQAIDLLHRIVNEVGQHSAWQNTALGEYRIIPSDEARRTLMDEGMSEQRIDEAACYGGWDQQRDQYVRFNEDGDLVGLDQTQADRLVWANRGEILAHAKEDGMLSGQTVSDIDHTFNQTDKPETRTRPGVLDAIRQRAAARANAHTATDARDRGIGHSR
ncbi:LPD11 domain-containing protein [Bifidobacterium sp. SO1]|uniref:LPD11 domain-containing protein n=1 Tax=Bifidobacterium sp. SO1 TaxID=2809029 RepID=UPI003204FA2A